MYILATFFKKAKIYQCLANPWLSWLRLEKSVWYTFQSGTLSAYHLVCRGCTILPLRNFDWRIYKNHVSAHLWSALPRHWWLSQSMRIRHSSVHLSHTCSLLFASNDHSTLRHWFHTNSKYYHSCPVLLQVWSILPEAGKASVWAHSHLPGCSWWSTPRTAGPKK